MKYYLMLYDEPVLVFEFLESLFGFPTCNENVLNSSLLPIGFSKIGSWLAERQPPKHRAHVKDLLKLCGIKDLKGYVDLTLCLSLNDSYWVKSEASGHITFSTINLYENEFSDTISKVAFSGGGLHGIGFSTTSPELSTDGALPKCWIREGSGIYLIKGGTEGASNTGYEPYSEFLSNQLCRHLGITNLVEYDLCNFHGTLSSRCELFSSMNRSFVNVYKMGLTNEPASLFLFYDKMNYIDRMAEIVILDALTINEDRHLGNFGWMYDSKTNDIIKPAPIFDNGQSLLPYITEDITAIEEYINTKGPKIGYDFIDVAKPFIKGDIKDRLISLSSFEFKQHPKYELPEWRLEILTGLVRTQAKKLLK